MNASEPQTQSCCKESNSILPNLSEEGGIVDCSQNVGDEVADALRAMGRKGLPAFAVVAPALPAAARITVDGTALIDGPSAAGETNSIDVVEALRQGGLRPAVIKRSEYADAQTLADRIRGVFLAECDAAVVDCTTDEDLVTVATAHRLLEFQSLLVGSAGLAAGVVNSLPGAVQAAGPSRCYAGSAHLYQSHRWPAKIIGNLPQIQQPGSLTRGDR
ncbi:four-carbon acid sugar kinase family protein [Arthrobacter sp. NPDC080073]|uniref:four-carbon acid sugar kinase family protein n=1 Tax=Arthrobacter sp. NPDC080073 TaxID=3155919 RepID=UPI0034224828